MRNVEIITHNILSKTLHLYLQTKTVRFNYIQFTQDITRNTSTLDIKISLPEFQTSLRVEGMSEIQAKRFPSIDFHRFQISTDKNHLIANDFYRFRFSFIDFSGVCNYTRNYRYFERWQI